MLVKGAPSDALNWGISSHNKAMIVKNHDELSQ